MAEPKVADPKDKAPDKPADPKAKSAAPDPAKASHFVVLHHVDHHPVGRVLKAVDVPPEGRDDFTGRYPQADCREIDRAAVPRLLSFRAIRPATDDEQNADLVPVAPWEGQAPRVNAQLVISRAEVEGYRERIRELEAQRGDPAEAKRLRERVEELENEQAKAAGGLSGATRRG